MSYPKQTVELRPIRGFISDTAPHEVGPDFWTAMDNVVIRGGFPQRRPASRECYATPVGTTAAGTFMHLLNCEVSGTNYWLVFEEDGTAWSITSTTATQIDNTLLQTVNNPVDYSSAQINGLPVFSNGVDEPVYWAGGNLTTLTDWTATESCGFIAVFKYHIFALDIDGPGGTFPNLLRWSTAAEPGTIPSSWTPAADNSAGDVELSDTPGGLLCAYPLRDSLLIYKRSSIYQVRWTGDNNVFQFRKLQSSFGALTRRSVCDVNGQHFVVTDGDIVLTDGTNKRSLGEARVKNWLFDQLDQTYYPNLFCVFNRAQNEVWTCFPSSGSEFCDTALVYNIETDSFGIRSLNAVQHAAIGFVDDTSESSVWADQTDTWATYVGAWGSSSVVSARDSLVLIQTDELHQQDVNDSETVAATLGKYSMPLGDPERVKFLRRIHLRTQGNYGTLYVRAGSQMSPNDSITWSSEVTMTAPDQVVNLFSQGRYISVEIRGAGTDVWKVTGLDLEIEQRGYF